MSSSDPIPTTLPEQLPPTGPHADRDRSSTISGGGHAEARSRWSSSTPWLGPNSTPAPGSVSNGRLERGPDLPFKPNGRL